MMSAVDEGVYNITQALKAHGVWDNTILVFTTGQSITGLGK
jgi:arylsulfatase A-like enzyme